MHCGNPSEWSVDFEVLDNASNVLGLKSSSEMKLVQRIEVLESDLLAKYADWSGMYHWDHSSYSSRSKPQTSGPSTPQGSSDHTVKGERRVRKDGTPECHLMYPKTHRLGQLDGKRR